MDEKIIKKIIEEVFAKAKTEHASHSKFALSNHVGDKTDLSSKTLERLHDKYISKKTKHGLPNADSIDLLCKYLGYDNYAAYIKQNPSSKKNPELENKTNIKSKWIKISISIVLGMLLMVFAIQNWPDQLQSKELQTNKCMTWADSLYLEATCDTGPFSKYGTKVEPYIKSRFKNLKEVEVNAAYPFFSEDHKPLIWYYKSKTGDLEYFTSPGLHPTNGETLKKITPHIIQTYVSLQSNNENSLIN